MIRLAVFLSLFVVLAGCSASVSTPEGVPESTGTLTPVPVPGDELDASELADSADAPAETNRTETLTMSAGDERLLRYESRLNYSTLRAEQRIAANGPATGVLPAERETATSLTERRYVHTTNNQAVRTVDGETVRMSWFDADETLAPPVAVRAERSAERSRTTGDTFSPPIPTSDSETIAELLSVPTEPAPNGSSGPADGYELLGTATEPPATIVAPWVSNPRNATLEVTLTDEALVRSAVLRYEADYEGRTVRVAYRIRYDI